MKINDFEKKLIKLLNTGDDVLIGFLIKDNIELSKEIDIKILSRIFKRPTTYLPPFFKPAEAQIKMIYERHNSEVASLLNFLIIHQQQDQAFYLLSLMNFSEKYTELYNSAIEKSLAHSDGIKFTMKIIMLSPEIKPSIISELLIKIIAEGWGNEYIKLIKRSNSKRSLEYCCGKSEKIHNFISHFSLAVSFKKLDALKILLDIGIKIPSGREYNPKAPLSIIIKKIVRENTEGNEKIEELKTSKILLLLMDYGFKLSNRDILALSTVPDPFYIKKVISSKYDINFQSGVSKYTPLLQAIRFSSLKVVKALFEAGASLPGVDINGKSVLSLAKDPEISNYIKKKMSIKKISSI